MLRIATRSLVTALVLTALLFPAGALAKVGFNAPQTPAAATPQTQRVEVASHDFQWRDAGIGAAAVLALLGAGAGMTVVARRRRHQLTPLA